MDRELDPAAIVNRVHYERLVQDYVFMFAAALLIYDYILTLRLEVKHIWFSRWTYTTILFLLIRCTTFVYIFLVIYRQFFLNIPVRWCSTLIHVESWLLIFKTQIAEIVLSIRTWAVWKRDKRVGAVLAFLLLANVPIQCILVVRFIHSVAYNPPPYPGFRGCLLVKASRVIWVNYAAFTLIEAVALVFMVVSAYRSYRYGSTGELVRVIHRDGILYYIYLLIIGVANVIVTIALPVTGINLLTGLEDVLFSVLTTRIVLNIREVASRDLRTNLHATHSEPAYAMPLRDRHVATPDQPAGPSYTSPEISQDVVGNETF